MLAFRPVGLVSIAIIYRSRTSVYILVTRLPCYFYGSLLGRSFDSNFLDPAGLLVAFADLIKVLRAVGYLLLVWCAVTKDNVKPESIALEQHGCGSKNVKPPLPACTKPLHENRADHLVLLLPCLGNLKRQTRISESHL